MQEEERSLHSGVHLPKGQHYSFHPANKYFHVKQIRVNETAILIDLCALLNPFALALLRAQRDLPVDGIALRSSASSQRRIGADAL